MVMTLKDHADIEGDGTLSPFQLRAREIRQRIAEAERRRDREDRRLMRLIRLQAVSDARHRAACEDVAALVGELRGMRA